jgi:pSer/pThr/pTyr-binding forkhead associated (FHA) protein
MRAQLIPVEGGAPIEIVKDLVVIGRKEDCDLRLEHKSVSKLHCVVVKTDGLLLLRDLGSTNGTRVNGTRVRRAALLPNDQVAIAHFKFKIFLGPDAAPPPPVKPHEHTQALEPGEVANLVQRRGGTERSDAADDVVEPVQRNQLPDLYPDESGK